MAVDSRFALRLTDLPVTSQLYIATIFSPPISLHFFFLQSADQNRQLLLHSFRPPFATTYSFDLLAYSIYPIYLLFFLHLRTLRSW
ncbi:hypothetical protein B0T10DRAFT_492286 [Thelonectria olida]|uniref:Uncharacterized protein n=1 Tax=Thelonectria olida TaxID=1576542 RepID=A0A9P9AMM0_9HYPO|nr:hypothetical protein B0T10DRAFT_492286 [Thelonectria olida]